MIWVRLEQRKSAYDFSQTLLDLNPPRLLQAKFGWHSTNFVDTLHISRALAASIDCDATSSNQDKSMA
jgi:hypothetical protein